MRDYGKVHSTFWSSGTIGALSDDGRMLALYLMTCPHATIAGVFRLPDGYACEDLKWTTERVSKGFTELFDKGFANRCETTKWVWIRKHLEWNPPENPNQRKAVAKIAESIPSECGWKLDFMRICMNSDNSSTPPNINPYTTLTEPFPNQEQEQEQEKEKEKAPRKRAKPSFKTSLPNDFGISERVAMWAKAKGFTRLDEYLEVFRSKAVAKGYTYADWDEGFMGCIREDWPGFRKANGATTAMQAGTPRQRRELGT